MPSASGFLFFFADEDDRFEANYFALLNMKRNCEDEPLGLIELLEYALEAYETL